MEPVLALHAAGPLVQGGQVGIQIAGITPPAGHLLAGGGNLPQGFGVVGDVGHDDQHVHALFKGQILRGGQGHAGRGDPLDGRVVGQVDEQHRAVDGAGAPEVADEEVGLLEGDAHGGEHHGESCRYCPAPVA